MHFHKLVRAALETERRVIEEPRGTLPHLQDALGALGATLPGETVTDDWEELLGRVVRLAATAWRLAEDGDKAFAIPGAGAGTFEKMLLDAMGQRLDTATDRLPVALSIAAGRLVQAGAEDSTSAMLVHAAAVYRLARELALNGDPFIDRLRGRGDEDRKARAELRELEAAAVRALRPSGGDRSVEELAAEERERQRAIVPAENKTKNPAKPGPKKGGGAKAGKSKGESDA